jgi:hypothetical protein
LSPSISKIRSFLSAYLSYAKSYTPDEKFDFNAYLYGGLNKNDNKEDADPMKEGLFRQCMKEIDDYLRETKGCYEIQWINSNSLAQHTPEDR